MFSISSLALIESIESRVLLSAGQIDTSFGGNGQVTATELFPNFVGGISAVQKDGKLLLAGADNSGNASHAAVIRLNASGSVDTSFGNNGEATFQFASGASENSIDTVALQADGKIVVVGGTQNSQHVQQGAIARLKTNGALDTSFNGTGVNQDSALNTTFITVSVQSNGKIVVGGFLDVSRNFLIARFNSNGTFDASFNKTGTESIDMGGDDLLEDVEPTSDGGMIGVGSLSNLNKFAAVKLTSSGSIDRSFGSNGRVYSNGFIPARDGLFIQSDGTFIVAGVDTSNRAVFFPEVRDFSARGKPAGFGTSKITVPNFNDLSAATQDKSGNIDLNVDTCVNENNTASRTVEVVRLTKAGKLDST